MVEAAAREDQMNAMYVLLGLSVTSTALLAINVIASAVVMIAIALLTPLREAADSSPATSFATSAAHRATLFFLLRILPALIAITVVGVLCVPSYVVYEPGGTSERVGPVLAILATVALALSFGAAWRTVACWRATSRLTRHWHAMAQPLDLRERRVTAWHHPAYRLDHSFPVMAVIGAFRPQLFISNAVLDALTDDELAAAVAHEQAHVATADNLRRMMMRSASDVFGLSSLARRVDRLWADAAEAAADESVARLGRDAALSLAAALLKITRLIPTGRTSPFPVISPAVAGAFLVAPREKLVDGNDQDAYSTMDTRRVGVASRVYCLVELADEFPEPMAGQLAGGDCTTLGRHGRTARGALVAGAVSILLALSVAAMAPRLQ